MARNYHAESDHLKLVPLIKELLKGKLTVHLEPVRQGTAAAPDLMYVSKAATTAVFSGSVLQ